MSFLSYELYNTTYCIGDSSPSLFSHFHITYSLILSPSVAHRLNYRESYASPIIEKESSQEIREKNHRINDVKMGQETRRRREDINSYLQDSSHLDDITIPYEVNGFEMPKNRNGTIKEEESERGREKERENGRERDRDRVMSCFDEGVVLYIMPISSKPQSRPRPRISGVDG